LYGRRMWFDQDDLAKRFLAQLQVDEGPHSRVPRRHVMTYHSEVGSPFSLAIGRCRPDHRAAA
jgi:hypothetical protein